MFWILCFWSFIALIYLYFDYFAPSYGYQVIPSMLDACSHSRYTDQIWTSAFRCLDISNYFIEKVGLLYIMRLIFYYSFWGVILMHLNWSVVQRRPAAQVFSISTCMCFCLIVAKVNDRNMKPGRKNLNVSRWLCCVVCGIVLLVTGLHNGIILPK
jgi:hypothetical protein